MSELVNDLIGVLAIYAPWESTFRLLTMYVQPLYNKNDALWRNKLAAEFANVLPEKDAELDWLTFYWKISRNHYGPQYLYSPLSGNLISLGSSYSPIAIHEVINQTTTIIAGGARRIIKELNIRSVAVSSNRSMHNNVLVERLGGNVELIRSEEVAPEVRWVFNVNWGVGRFTAISERGYSVNYAFLYRPDNPIVRYELVGVRLKVYYRDGTFDYSSDRSSFVETYTVRPESIVSLGDCGDLLRNRTIRPTRKTCAVEEELSKISDIQYITRGDGGHYVLLIDDLR